MVTFTKYGCVDTPNDDPRNIETKKTKEDIDIGNDVTVWTFATYVLAVQIIFDNVVFHHRWTIIEH